MDGGNQSAQDVIAPSVSVTERVRDRIERLGEDFAALDALDQIEARQVPIRHTLDRHHFLTSEARRLLRSPKKKRGRPKRIRSKEYGSIRVTNSEFMQIKNLLKSLKSESLRHFDAESEAATELEFVHSQLRSVRKAFATLADVILEEVDTIRDEFASAFKAQSGELAKTKKHTNHLEMVHKVQSEEIKELRSMHKDAMREIKTLRADIKELDNCNTRAEKIQEMRTKEIGDLNAKIHMVHENSNQNFEHFKYSFGNYAKELEQGVNDALGQLQGECKKTAESLIRQLGAQREIASALGSVQNRVRSLEAAHDTSEKRARAEQDQMKLHGNDLSKISRRCDDIEASVKMNVENIKRAIAEAEATQRSLFNQVRDTIQGGM